ncbi:MAG: type II toxin-antitoxin system HicB family antitoxin [Pyrinomonadaceae bacterium MAG19_C2-C3]|nr:type II toxin-antitoxin system HicB family antitoxin [Pyrinomonadaceae bacterium MAG19_C2-C3]
MNNTQRLTAFIHREDSLYVSICPELDIASQGKTVEEARNNLIEAVELFFEVASEKEIERRFNSETYVTSLEVAIG